ncbi:MAG: membrane protein insertase YidC, partial [Mucilaginibacter sp.]
MDKNSYMGFFLIVLIMIGSYFFLKGPADQAKKLQAQQDSIKAVQAATEKPSATTAKFDSTKKTAVVDTTALKATPFGAASVGSQKFTTLENKDLLIKLSNKGGRVYSVELKNYKTFDKKPLILFKGDSSNSFGLNLRVADKPVNTNDYYFTPSASGLTVAERDSSSITMRLSYSTTQYIDYIYSLKGAGFKLGLTIKATGLDNLIANSNTLNLSWSANLPKQEMDMKQERSYSEIYYRNTENEVSDFGDTKDDQKTITDKKLQWVAFKEHFFSDIL